MPNPSEEVLFFNGDYIPLSQGLVSVEDRGYQFADGVYDVVRFLRGRLFRLEAHMRRLERSADGIYLPLAYSAEELGEICSELARRAEFDEGIVYIQATRGATPRNHLPPDDGMRPTTLAYARPIARTKLDRWERGWTVMSKQDDRWGHCDLKTIALLPNILAKMEAHKIGADDALYYGADGAVYECYSGNVFCVIDGRAYTHPECGKLLSGVTRTVVFDVCAELGIEVREEPRSLEDYLAADEVFISSTTRDVHPVVSIDGRPIAGGKPGPVARRILHGIWNVLEREMGANP